MRLLSLLLVCLFVAPAAATATSPGRDGRLLVHFENSESSSQSVYPSALVTATRSNGGDPQPLGECSSPGALVPPPAESTDYGLCGAPNAEWSPDGEQLAFGVNGIATARADGTGMRLVTQPSTEYSDSKPTWSPDGRTIAFVRESRVAVDSSGVGRRDVYTVKSDGSGLRRLTDVGTTFDVAWSSRGDIAYASNPASGWRIVRVDSRGRGARTLYKGSFSTMDWRPDGKVLTFTRTDPTNVKRRGIWAVSRAGGRARLQAPGLRDAFWSPSGKWMAAYDDDGFVIARADGSRRREVTVDYRHPSGLGTYAEVLAWQPLPRR